MYEIKVKASFSAAHNLKNYHGKCENLHGHNWHTEAVFAFDSLGPDGIAMDFRKAKGLLKGVTEKLDHSYLNKEKRLEGANPTSENIAKFIYDNLKRKTGSVRSVSVWENENSCATYSED